MPHEHNPVNQTALRVKFAREGDIRSFVQLVQPIHQRLHAYAYLMTGSVQDAEFCLQQGLLAARKALEGIGETRFDVFIYRHIHESVHALIRGRPFRPPENEPWEESGPALHEAIETGDMDLLGALAQPLLKRLATEERDALLLMVATELPRETLLEVAGVEEDVFQARLKRAAREVDGSDSSFSSGFTEPQDAESFWESLGEGLVVSSPRPVKSVDDLLSESPRRQARPKSYSTFRPTGGGAWRNPVVLLMVFLGGMVCGFGFAWSRQASPDAVTESVPASTRHFVRFVLEEPLASDVSLVGDFNDWDPSATPLRERFTSGVWETWVEIPAGRHQYAFILDGELVPDPLNAENIRTASGMVSVIHIPASAER